MLTAVLAFAGVAAVINVTPGLDTLLVLRTSVSQGKTAGLSAALGIVMGCLAWGLAAAVGLTALLTASHVAYDTMRIAGAVYLTWLGVSALWRSRRRHTTRATTGPNHLARQACPDAVAEQTAAESPRGRFAAFRSGIGTNLLNPKAGVFYMSLVPQFIPHGEPVFSSTVLFTVIDVVELSIWFWVVSGAASALGERIRRPAFRRRTEQASGIAFIGFAASLLTEHS
ncbi:LysE family translocator [Streptantibioticus rubrisoli]|uniref:LysE family translocator n=1 Tax=Streptantibioticus rubrisoli TaxID=1387313 RepID=A0ABT1PH35_9ACTN|nr:LysE family translocator [Streptantibioticus rubrisoli]MCQ4044682.1 LysE family translocator [Streptantibioticus rubrisoli]